MRKRVLHILPIVTNRWNEAIRRSVASVASAEFEHTFTNIRCGALESFEGLYDVAVTVPYIVDEIIEAQKGGYAAVTSLCFGSPGVKEGREVVGIPVVGAGEAAFYVALMCGERIGVVTVGGTYRTRNHGVFLNEIRRMSSGYGLRDRVVSCRTTGVGCADCDENSTFDALCREGSAAIEEGAEVLVLGCTGMVEVSARLQDRLQVPVVDPTTATVKYAELLLTLSLAHSKLTTPNPSQVGTRSRLKWPADLRNHTA